MAMAFMNVFDANVVKNIWELMPLPDITIKVIDESHYVASNEHIFVVSVGTTASEIKEKLLDTGLRKFGWIATDMLLEEYTTDWFVAQDELNRDMTLWLTLRPYYYARFPK